MPTVQEVHENIDYNTSNPRLRFKMGIIKTILERGASQFFMDLPAVPLAERSEDIVLEREEPPGSSVRSPYTRNVTKTNARTARISVPPKALMRDVETPIKGKLFSDQFFGARNTRLHQNAKKLGKDHITSSFLGMGGGDNVWGIEYWLQGYAGLHQGGQTVQYPNDSTDVTWPKHEAQKFFVTSTGEIDGTAQTLDGDVLNQLHAQCGNNRFQQVACNEDTFLAIENILDNLPGATPEYIRNAQYPMGAVIHKGTAYVRYDALDRDKVSTRGELGGSGQTLTIDAPEPDDHEERWPGFSDRDHGTTVTITDGSTTHETTLAQIDDWTTAQLASAAPTGLQGTSELTVTVEPSNVMYGLYFDEYEGVHMLYGDEEGEDLASADPGDEYGSIIGFNHYDAGRLQSGGRWYIDQIDWWGNLGVAGPHSVARASHFNLP